MPSASESRDFPSVMADLGMLPADSAADLHRESAERQVSPTKLALEKGLLTADQVEIADALLAPHDAIPGYELLSLIGHGGMGAVFRARQKSLNRIVALKTVLLSRIAGANAVARFEQEAITLARLVHPHIVSAYDFGRSNSKLYLVLEYVEGEDAENLAQRRGPLPEALAWQLVRQAAAGLAHAAAIGVVHRDIKPANLLLVDPPAGFPLPKGVPLVKIADFGLALLVSEDACDTRLTTANTALGSPNYMAPEQVTGEPVDLRSDVYALGATAYHFLTGAAPFAGLGMQAILGQKIAGRSQPVRDRRPEVSPASAALVEKMMSLMPEDRLQNYAELLERIDDVLRTSGGVVDYGRRELPNFEKTLEMPATNVNLADGQTIVEKADATVGAAPPAQPASRRGVLLAGVALCAIAALACIAWLVQQSFGNKSAAKLPPYDPARYYPEYSLFTGDDVIGFSDLSGEWMPTKDPEGGMVLSGKRSAATRFLLKDVVGANQPEQFRVTLVVQPHEATAAHLDFGWDSATNQFRHHLNFTRELVQAESRFGRSRNLSPPFKLDPDQKEIALELVRFPDYWWILINGRGHVTINAAAGDADRVRLSVDGGPAWFSDFSIAPWQPK